MQHLYINIVWTLSDKERFLLNGPMAPSSKFQWAIQKIKYIYCHWQKYRSWRWHKPGQNESQMSESNNKTTETERSEHRKYRQVSEKLWPWLYLNENKMFAVYVFVSTGLLLSSLLLLNEKLNNVFCPGKFSNLCFFFLFKSLKFKRLWSNKCYTILKLISWG
jgi:hypothetical protein